MREDVEMRTLIPAYPAVKAKLGDAEVAHEYADLFGGPARVIAGRTAGLDIFALDAPHLFDRPGNPYLGPDGTGLAGQRAPLRRARAGRRRHRARRDRGVPAEGRARARLAGRPRGRLSPLRRRRGGRDR